MLKSFWNEKLWLLKIPGREYIDNSDNRYDLDEVLEKM